MRFGRNVNYSTRRWSFKQIKKQISEQKVAQMIDAKVSLKAVLCFWKGHTEKSCIVY